MIKDSLETKAKFIVNKFTGSPRGRFIIGGALFLGLAACGEESKKETSVIATTSNTSDGGATFGVQTPEGSITPTIATTPIVAASPFPRVTETQVSTTKVTAAQAQITPGVEVASSTINSAELGKRESVNILQGIKSNEAAISQVHLVLSLAEAQRLEEQMLPVSIALQIAASREKILGYNIPVGFGAYPIAKFDASKMPQELKFFPLVTSDVDSKLIGVLSPTSNGTSDELPQFYKDHLLELSVSTITAGFVKAFTLAAFITENSSANASIATASPEKLVDLISQNVNLNGMIVQGRNSNFGSDLKVYLGKELKRLDAQYKETKNGKNGLIFDKKADPVRAERERRLDIEELAKTFSLVAVANWSDRNVVVNNESIIKLAVEHRNITNFFVSSLITTGKFYDSLKRFILNK